MTQHNFTKAIIEDINTLFAEEVGPVAIILCEEAEREWLADLEKLRLRKSIRSVLTYVDKLVPHIEGEDNQERFLVAVHNIEALRAYKI